MTTSTPIFYRAEVPDLSLPLILPLIATDLDDSGNRYPPPLLHCDIQGVSGKSPGLAFHSRASSRTRSRSPSLGPGPSQSTKRYRPYQSSRPLARALSPLTSSNTCDSVTPALQSEWAATPQSVPVSVVGRMEKICRPPRASCLDTEEFASHLPTDHKKRWEQIRVRSPLYNLTG